MTRKEGKKLVWKFMAIKFNVLPILNKKGDPFWQLLKDWKVTLTVACGIKTLLQQISRTDMLINRTVPNSVKCWQKLSNRLYSALLLIQSILLLISGIQNCFSEITTHYVEQHYSCFNFTIYQELNTLIEAKSLF